MVGLFKESSRNIKGTWGKQNKCLNGCKSSTSRVHNSLMNCRFLNLRSFPICITQRAHFSYVWLMHTTHLRSKILLTKYTWTIRGPSVDWRDGHCRMFFLMVSAVSESTFISFDPCKETKAQRMSRRTGIRIHIFLLQGISSFHCMGLPLLLLK